MPPLRKRLSVQCERLSENLGATMRTETRPTTPFPVNRYRVYAVELSPDKALVFQAANACNAAQLYMMEMTRQPTPQEVINAGFDQEREVMVEQEGTDHCWQIRVEYVSYCDTTVLDNTGNAPRAWAAPEVE